MQLIRKLSPTGVLGALALLWGLGVAIGGFPLAAAQASRAELPTLLFIQGKLREGARKPTETTWRGSGPCL